MGYRQILHQNDRMLTKLQWEPIPKNINMHKTSDLQDLWTKLYAFCYSQQFCWLPNPLLYYPLSFKSVLFLPIKQYYTSKA